MTFAAALSLTGTSVSLMKKAPIETKKAIIITGLIIRVKDMPDAFSATSSELAESLLKPSSAASRQLMGMAVAAILGR
ncbi:hypothetical protein SDC9_163923 [bioreactor metagenome]|uniref:Uncharacterized protein n=1 Tax=bioreactor metagenome TaxID=1076179 RepID=A0A645FQ75_9ZZZZ